MLTRITMAYYSGLVAYRDFAQAGFDVWLFERDTVPGGTWHYTEEAHTKTPVPNADISVGDFVPSLPPEGVALPYEENYEGEVSEETLRVHRSPKPIWKSLRTSTPPVRALTFQSRHVRGEHLYIYKAISGGKALSISSFSTCL
jgi:cation diffusion facilitator CzcD-associated flavoprotein CzcO